MRSDCGSLQFEENQVSLSIERQDVDGVPEGRCHLLAEQQEILAYEAQVLADPSFQPGFQIQLGGGQSDGAIAFDAPDLHLYRHTLAFYRSRVAEFDRDWNKAKPQGRHCPA